MRWFEWLVPNSYRTHCSVRSSSERGKGDRMMYRVELEELVAERMMKGVCLLGGVGGLLS